MRINELKKVAILVLFCAMIVMFWAFHLEDYFSLEQLKGLLSGLADMYAAKPLLVIAGYIIIYIVITMLALPVSIPLTLLGGAIFGFWTGTLVVSFASSLGAAAAFIVSRYLLRDWVQRMFGDRLAVINRGIGEEGAFYLFSLRLVPIIPFEAINFAMGITPMPLRTFYIVSQIGMLPAAMIFINAGQELSIIESAAGILSPTLIISLALIAVFPFGGRRLLIFYRRRKVRQADQKEK
jgi:uncharacterized membrane protein YdjX (TVP38/TMEM64 family)